jgi:hypothetical protein
MYIIDLVSTKLYSCLAHPLPCSLQEGYTMTNNLDDFRQKFQVNTLEIVTLEHWTWSVRMTIASSARV